MSRGLILGPKIPYHLPVITAPLCSTLVALCDGPGPVACGPARHCAARGKAQWPCLAQERARKFLAKWKSKLTSCTDYTPTYNLHWAQSRGLIIKAVGRNLYKYWDYCADGFQALILSASYTETHLLDRRYIKVSTYGILFMGTPHQGGEGVTWDILARNLASIFANTNKEFLEQFLQFL